MKILYLLIVALLPPIFAKDNNRCQFLLCPQRKTTVQQYNLQTSNKCVFCDTAILAQNYIVHEDMVGDVRIMMNKFPYCYFDQAHHLLIMPISHKISFAEFSHDDLKAQIHKTLCASALLYESSYSQEYCFNLGEGGGQSVPHLHSHLFAFIQPPSSLPDLVKYKESPTNTIDVAFESVKSKLASINNIPIPIRDGISRNENCYYCSMINNKEYDNEKFVIGRFKYNMVCIANFPRIAAEVIIIPYNHGHALHHLSLDEALENITLSLILLPLLKVYVQEKVRQWKGDNIFIKIVGNKASEEEKNDYHLYTSIMPRTIISSPSGTLDGNSCKLDFDPQDLYQYLKKELNNLQRTEFQIDINKEWLAM